MIYTINQNNVKNYWQDFYDDNVLIENIIIFKSKVMQLPLCSPWHLIYDSTMKITTSNDQYAKKILYVIDKKIEQNIMSNILWWWITDKRHRYTQIKKMYLPLYLPWYFKNRFNNETYDLKLLIRKKMIFVIN